MSVQARTWARGRAPKKLSALLFAIADYADKSGVAWVGQRTLAHDLNCGRRTVIRELAELGELELVRRVRAHGEDGRRAHNFMVLAPAAEDRGPMTDAQDGDGEHPPEVCSLARRHVPTVAPSPCDSHVPTGAA